MWSRIFSKVKSRVKSVCAGVALAGAALVSLPQKAHAILPADQQTAVDGVTTLVTDYTAVAWTIVLAISAVTFGMTIYKKFVGGGISKG